MELKKPWSLWCSPVRISHKSLQAELVKQKTNFIGKRSFHKRCKSYVGFTSEHVPILNHGFQMIATIAKNQISVIAAIIWQPLSSDRSDNDRWDITFSISAIVVAAIAGESFPYDLYNGCDRWTFFFFSAIAAIISKPGLSISWKCGYAPTCTVHPLVQPLPLSIFFFRTCEGWEGMRLSVAAA